MARGAHAPPHVVIGAPADHIFPCYFHTLCWMDSNRVLGGARSSRPPRSASRRTLFRRQAAKTEKLFAPSRLCVKISLSYVVGSSK
jgi:hypothetical protein